jgi:hypothetical protein
MIAIFWLLFLLSIVSAGTASGFENVYKCRSVAETSLGFAPFKAEVDFGAGKVKQPATVAITGIKTDKPVFHGQGTTPLIKLVETGNVIWFLEQAPAGTVIIWTLFEGDKLRPPALISSKSYDFFGAVNFAAFYTCE